MLAVSIIILDIVSTSYAKTSILKLIELTFKGERSHFLEKFNLVKGDLVIIEYRGKYRKAYIKDISNISSLKFQLEFEDFKLNSKEFEYVWYPMERIIVPKYLGKAANLLFTEMEKNHAK